MRKQVLFALTAALWVLLVGIATSSFAAEEETGKKPRALTTEDPEIPVEELELILKAFTKDELLVEADGWQGLLRAKVAEIGKAEIAVKRHSREIAMAQEVQDQAQEAKKQLDELQEKAVDAKATGDAKKIQETEQSVAQAQETVDEIKATLDEAAEAALETADIQQRMDPKTREGIEDTADAAGQAQEALEKAQDAVTGADVGDRDSVPAAAGEAEAATEEAQQATSVVEENVGKVLERAEAGADTAEALEAAMERAEEAKKEQKVHLLENLNALREERIQLTDCLNAVLAELEFKTDGEDTDTLAKIRDYRLYIRSVQGIELEAGDFTANWIAIKGWLISEEGGLRWAKNIAVFLAIIFVAWTISGLISRAVRRALGMTGRVSQLLEGFLVGSVRWVVMAVGIVMALAALEVSVGPLLAAVGAAGFVIAFALQESLSNFASGIMILFFRPFDVGDVVDAGGVTGKVMTMNLVSTTIKTFDNKDMVVPNNKIWNEVITNVTAVDIRRVDMEFCIGYDDDIDRAQAILEEIVGSHPKALKEPEPTIRMNTLADSSVNFICRPWARTEDLWGVYWDILKEVKKRFDAEGIGIPYPQRDVHLYIADKAEAKKKLSVLPSAEGTETVK